MEEGINIAINNNTNISKSKKESNSKVKEKGLNNSMIKDN